MKNDPERMRVIRGLLQDPFSGHGLTKKEKEAATLSAASALTQDEIAERLGITKQAVFRRLTRACKKMGLNSSKELTAYFIGLLRNAAGL